MGRAFGLISVVVVLGIGLHFYGNQIKEVSAGGETPRSTVSVTGVRNDLLAMANAERRYWASNAKYASLDELSKNSDIEVPTRADFTYSIDANANNFTITATYRGPDPHAPKRITINDTMAIASK